MYPNAGQLSGECYQGQRFWELDMNKGECRKEIQYEYLSVWPCPFFSCGCQDLDLHILFIYFSELLTILPLESWNAYLISLLPHAPPAGWPGLLTHWGQRKPPKWCSHHIPPCSKGQYNTTTIYFLSDKHSARAMDLPAWKNFCSQENSRCFYLQSSRKRRHVNNEF